MFYTESSNSISGEWNVSIFWFTLNKESLLTEISILESNSVEYG